MKEPAHGISNTHILRERLPSGEAAVFRYFLKA
jgi:hypothetical protein